LSAERASSLFSIAEYPILWACIWAQGDMWASSRSSTECGGRMSRLRKLNGFSFFSILFRLVQPGTSPGAEYVQEAQFPSCFEKLVRSLIKLWRTYIDFLEQASRVYAAYLTWAVLDSGEIIYSLPPIPKNVFFPTSLLAASLERVIGLPLPCKGDFPPASVPLMTLFWPSPQAEGAAETWDKAMASPVPRCPQGCLSVVTARLSASSISQPFSS